MEEVMASAPLGAYIRALRKKQKMSQGKLAEITGVTGNTIYRIESGRQEPKTPLIAELLTALGGRIKDVRTLLRNGATTAEAAPLAEEAITEQALLALANTDPKRAALLKRIAELSDDPVLTARLESYLDGLGAK